MSRPCEMNGRPPKGRPDGRIVRDPIVYVDTAEKRTLDLRPDGIACVPLLGLSRFQSQRTGTGEHIHAGCVEFVFRRILGVTPSSCRR